ncbi:uncharacterized protein LOC112003695 isoform X3 [Quercus suber]|uniref:uncharacterized protein LOC112003695 isoform X3 n=1 Tax=Quercus suber TaxID=58331 RepID=UPI0032DEDD27
MLLHSRLCSGDKVPKSQADFSQKAFLFAYQTVVHHWACFLPLYSVLLPSFRSRCLTVRRQEHVYPDQTGLSPKALLKYLLRVSNTFTCNVEAELHEIEIDSIDVTRKAEGCRRMHYYNVKYLIKSKTFSVNQINLSKFIHSLRFLSKNPSHLRSPLPPIFGSKVQGTTGQLQLPPVPPIAGKTSNVQEQGERSSKKKGERTKVST